jgi:hypothetical protein
MHANSIAALATSAKITADDDIDLQQRKQQVT